MGKNDPPLPTNVPAEVHLQVRHLSASYFRAGKEEEAIDEEGTGNEEDTDTDNEEVEGEEDNIKQYRQPIGSYRDITFDRFTVTKESKCNKKKAKGEGSKYSRDCFLL